MMTNNEHMSIERSQYTHINIYTISLIWK